MSEVTERDMTLVKALDGVVEELVKRTTRIISDLPASDIRRMMCAVGDPSSCRLMDTMHLVVLFSDAELQAKVRTIISEYRGTEDEN